MQEMRKQQEAEMQQVKAELDEMRSKVKAAKAKYEDALREKFFGF